MKYLPKMNGRLVKHEINSDKGPDVFKEGCILLGVQVNRHLHSPGTW